MDCIQETPGDGNYQGRRPKCRQFIFCPAAKMYEFSHKVLCLEHWLLVGWQAYGEWPNFLISDIMSAAYWSLGSLAKYFSIGSSWSIRSKRMETMSTRLT